MERRKKITMGTRIRPNISKKNKYWIERHRYYELKHFCLQYHVWKKCYAALRSVGTGTSDSSTPVSTGGHSDPTAKCAMARMFYSDRIGMVERAAQEADSELAAYILEAVTEGHSYENLKTRLNIPCSKDVYYDRYRKFFWLLSMERQ